MNASLAWGKPALDDRHVFGIGALLGASAVGVVVGALVMQAVDAVSESMASAQAPVRVDAIAMAQAAPPPEIDHSVVDWNRLAAEPDAAALSVGAYE